MITAKELMKQILENQPDDSSYDEILRELAFKRMLDKGMTDVTEGKLVSNEEMKKRIQTWQK
ncbi:hypothetical protein MNBD_GAMMA24-1787 [hydrothermal vent metagenome]|uniref:Uncharacterized protein n=1 Tax=hydrothermal vent metagenome TaxID=652676 RepID=A0A3B1C7H8_9ZZZZ